jgi:hypothetical protein
MSGRTAICALALLANGACSSSKESSPSQTPPEAVRPQSAAVAHYTITAAQANTWAEHIQLENDRLLKADGGSYAAPTSR